MNQSRAAAGGGVWGKANTEMGWRMGSPRAHDTVEGDEMSVFTILTVVGTDV